VSTPVTELADAFRAAAEKHLCEAGDYAPLVRYSFPIAPAHHRLRVELPAAKDGHLHPALALEFDTFEAALPKLGRIGFVPALGVEAVAKTSAELEKRLLEAIRLDLARRRRLASVRELVATQWYAGVELTPTAIELPAYSLTELRDLRARTFKRLLPDVAVELAPPATRTVGLDAELDQLSRALRGRYRRSILVVGPSGSGKSALIEEYARGRHGERKIWEVTAARLIQKLTRGEGWQKNLARFCNDLRDTGDLLYVRAFSDLFEVGQYAGNSLSIADALRGPIERGEVTLLTECTPEQAARLDVRAPGYLALFHSIRLVEPQGDKLEAIVRRRVEATAAVLSAKTETAAIGEALRLHRRYTPYSGLPGKVIRFLEAIVRDPKRLDENAALTRRAVLRQFCADTGMPDFMVDPDQPLPLDRMERHFRHNVFGQDEAVDTVIDLLAQVKTGLARGGKPIASLLFIGPTGVGKTELAKVLAEFTFGNRARMIRFDMSEFADVPAVLRLTGEAGGPRDGLLTGAVRQDPFAVVLLDEVEKAHPVFFDLLLQILGDGRLTDARGRTADFCSTIVVMTSNVGAASLPQSKLGFGEAGDRRREVLAHFRREVEQFFRPELFNRLDRVVAFAPLGRETIRRVVDRELKLARLRPGLRHRDIELSVDDAVLDRLGERGYDAAYGARQLQRAIREELVVPLARQLNRYGGTQALAAAVALKGDRLSVQVRGVDRPALAERVVGATGLTLREIADRTTIERRRMAAVAEGSLALELRSEVEILERLRRRTKERDWVKSEFARRFELLSAIARAVDAATADAEWLESEALLALVDPDRAAPADLHALLEDARGRSWDTMVRLYDTLKPDTRRCALGIYGQDAPLRTLARAYERIARLFGIASSTHSVWLLPPPGRRSGRIICPVCGATIAGAVAKCPSCAQVIGESFLAQPVDRAAPEGARLVGYELALDGPLAWVAFRDEGGKHAMRDARGDKSEFVVLVGQCARAAFEASRPKDVHRQSFFKQMGEPRRTIDPSGFQDKPYDVKSAVPEYAEALEDVLRLLLEAQLVRLLSE
jgi:ATP-dependent Clp protease ATP-binding subunit ClpA